jgi:hypothetical protein
LGKILDIRVTARTYSEDDVAKTWPRLALLAWPEWSAGLGMDRVSDSLPGYSPGISLAEKALGTRKHGVMELAQALPDLLKFCGLPDNFVKALEEPVSLVERLRRELEAALGDWDTKSALALTFKLEDALGAAERSLDAAR